ncbi:histidinol-phosphatase, PHP family [Nitratiruptor sp. YY08-26]|uniref:histidinol-phosphatase HisJ n=1 Tax=unclassified Nitratiruptor TaxID=2624044 RepID=UPI0019159CF0|nr:MULTISPECIES: histidinol-phosphatase HisJ [unclassified Nitratiruptor]BCD62799.1 histidinol-phosphatase, PHP family [Nitratiruptor sp. YY08-13]BCD66735.1 histidinol-phosphatase, PHP family [Nitratiruptor sp. YY08-26]
MRVDLHNHTKRCNHATGEMEEYVQRAIAEDIDIYGFSDHAPMNFDQKYRMSLEETDAYEKDVKELKEKYKNKIEILLGYEVDFLPGLIEDRIVQADVDYLIGSVHFLPKSRKHDEILIHQDLWGFDNPEFIGEYKNKDINTIWEDYFSAIEALAKSGLFQIVGHLDLIKVFNFKPKKDVRLIAKNALKAIKENNLVLEISSAGLRKPVGEPYPSKELLEEAFTLDIPITFASDAHAPEQVGYKLDDVMQMAKEVGYTKCAVFRKKEREFIEF